MLAARRGDGAGAAAAAAAGTAAVPLGVATPVLAGRTTAWLDGLLGLGGGALLSNGNCTAAWFDGLLGRGGG